MTNVVFFAIVYCMETSNGEDQGPTSIGEILDDIGQVLEHELDPSRERDVEETRLTAEVDELDRRREGLVEAVAKGETTDEMRQAIREISEAGLAARADLNEIRRQGREEPEHE